MKKHQMKNILLLLITFVGLKISAQVESIRIEKITTNEKIIHGYIDDKYPITIFLKTYEPSGFHGGIFKIKGWYYYDNIKTKIPLVGVNGENIILYNLKNNSDFLKEKLNHWDDLEKLENISNYSEKIILSQKKSKWFSNKKELDITINTNDLSIQKKIEYLQLTKEKSFDLNQLNARNFSILISTKNRVLLEYEYQSRLNAIGMCGAGTEKGYFLIEYDNNFNIINFIQYNTESCLEHIYSEKELSDNKITHKVSNLTNDTFFRITIDLEKVIIKKN